MVTFWPLVSDRCAAGPSLTGRKHLRTLRRSTLEGCEEPLECVADTSELEGVVGEDEHCGVGRVRVRVDSENVTAVPAEMGGVTPDDVDVDGVAEAGDVEHAAARVPSAAKLPADPAGCAGLPTVRRVPVDPVGAEHRPGRIDVCAVRVAADPPVSDTYPVPRALHRAVMVLVGFLPAARRVAEREVVEVALSYLPVRSGLGGHQTAYRVK